MHTHAQICVHLHMHSMHTRTYMYARIHTHTHAHTQSPLHSYPHNTQDQRLLYHQWYMPSLLPLDYLAHCLWPSVSTVERSPTNCSTYTCSSRNCLYQQQSTLGKNIHIHTSTNVCAFACTHIHLCILYIPTSHDPRLLQYIIDSIRATSCLHPIHILMYEKFQQNSTRRNYS